jgi:hypothetical protein
VHTGFGWQDLRERTHLEYLDVDGRLILKQIFKKYKQRKWTGLICLRIGTVGELL